MLCGNIGEPLAAQVDGPPGRSFVVELSSFQLETVRTFHADAAALLNVTPDHLDRYPDFAAYAAAKARIFERQDERSVAVLNADDPETVAIGAGVARSRRRWFSLRRAGRGWLLCRQRRRDRGLGRTRGGALHHRRGGDGGQPQRRERDGGVAARARRRWRSGQPAPRRRPVRRTAAPHPPHPRAPRRGLVRRLQGHQRRRHVEVARRVPRPLGAPHPRRGRQGPGLCTAARVGRAQGQGGLPHRRRRARDRAGACRAPRRRGARPRSSARWSKRTRPPPAATSCCCRRPAPASISSPTSRTAGAGSRSWWRRSTTERRDG